MSLPTSAARVFRALESLSHGLVRSSWSSLPVWRTVRPDWHCWPERMVNVASDDNEYQSHGKKNELHDASMLSQPIDFVLRSRGMESSASECRESWATSECYSDCANPFRSGSHATCCSAGCCTACCPQVRSHSSRSFSSNHSWTRKNEILYFNNRRYELERVVMDKTLTLI